MLTLKVHGEIDAFLLGLEAGIDLVAAIDAARPASAALIVPGEERH
jgi:hypothetical protein